MQQAATCQRLCHAACQGKQSKPPAKALPPSITATYPVCHAACKKNSKRPASPNECTQSKEVGPQRFYVGLPVFVSAQSPCLQKSSKAGVPPLLPEGNRFADKNHPPWDGLKICQFAFLHKGRSLPRSTLCSSLPPLHKKFAWA